MRDSIPCWQKKLAEGYASAAEILDALQLPRTLGHVGAELQFKTRVPRGFVARMEVGNSDDPLLRQVLAIGAELDPAVGFVRDPLDENAAIVSKGLIHKYHGRVLLILTGACAINCRYCFRRHFPYQDHNPGRHGWNDIIAYINNDPCICEVILSGGDPLLLKDEVLAQLFMQLDAIPHLRTLRIHTRMPVVLPERIDRSFIDLLSTTRLHKVVVLHSNHPLELDAQVGIACTALHKANCHLLNQSVLLAGVNDNARVLAGLSERLFECKVMPYYLHLLDKVQGAAHFAVSTEAALVIFRELQALLPGYLVPRLACEQAFKSSKTLLV